MKKIEGDPPGTLENSRKKNKIDDFEQCHSAENVEGRIF